MTNKLDSLLEDYLANYPIKHKKRRKRPNKIKDIRKYALNKDICLTKEINEYEKFVEFDEDSLVKVIGKRTSALWGGILLDNDITDIELLESKNLPNNLVVERSHGCWLYHRHKYCIEDANGTKLDVYSLINLNPKYYNIELELDFILGILDDAHIIQNTNRISHKLVSKFPKKYTKIIEQAEKESNFYSETYTQSRGRTELKQYLKSFKSVEQAEDDEILSAKKDLFIKEDFVW